MPIRIPNDLPAVKTLNDENIFVMTETRAITQDIRPLKILLLNLMPKKIETETQISRILGIFKPVASILAWFKASFKTSAFE